MLSKKSIAIIGGGPSALFMYKRLVDTQENVSVDIFEKQNELGTGMPYSRVGACEEHITNVSGNELPAIVCSIQEWLQHAPKDLLNHFEIWPDNFNDFKVLPRLFFGKYLSYQFSFLIQQAKATGLQTTVHLSSNVTDIRDKPEDKKVVVITDKSDYIFDYVIICTGHNWPLIHEGKIPNYFDSPYPPAKLAVQFNHPVAIRGSSLTAIDAIRTLARHNGQFEEKKNDKLEYQLAARSDSFKLVLHSRNGMLPAIRFHLKDSHLAKGDVLSEEVIQQNRMENNGFLSLDFIFSENFKKPLLKTDPETYGWIKDKSIEEFVEEMMRLRENLDAFTLLKAEYAEAEKSIKRKQSVYWKEMLATLSFAMNYPAKHFSAEDMIRLQKVLMPLISIVIAFVPQRSTRELLALYEAGVLEIITVGDESFVEPNKNGGGAIVHFTDEKNKQRALEYAMFVDSIGQPHLHFDQFPFKSLLNEKVISRALLKFRSKIAGETALATNNKHVEKSSSGDYYLRVPGININDDFQVLDAYDALNPRIYIMAVPYIAGYNPDYSGLDFCEAASARIIKSLRSTLNENAGE